MVQAQTFPYFMQVELIMNKRGKGNQVLSICLKHYYSSLFNISVSPRMEQSRQYINSIGSILVGLITLTTFATKPFPIDMAFCDILL